MFEAEAGLAHRFVLPAQFGIFEERSQRLESLDDFKPVNRILFPFTITEQNGQHHAVVNITSVRVNSDVSIADFKKK